MTQPRLIRSTALALVALSALSSPAALAKKGHKPDKTKPQTTHMRFKLVEHEVNVGDEIVGNVSMFTKKRSTVTPISGAELTVLVNKEEVGTVTTDEAGKATVSHVVDADDETIRVVFTGDDGHKKRHRAQGIDVLEPVVEEPIVEEPVVDGSTEVVTP